MIEKSEIRLNETLTFLTWSLIAGFLISKTVLTVSDVMLALHNGPRYLIFVEVFRNLLIQPETIFVGCIALFVFFFKLKRIDFNLSIKLNPKKLMDFLIYLYALTFFIIPLPAIFNTAVLFLLCIRKTSIKKPKNLFSFWVVVFFFLLLETIGVISAFAGINEIREKIPLMIQFLSLIPFLNAFMVYYVIIRNNWGYEEFERFFKILIFCGAIVAIESILTFYLGIGENISFGGVLPIKWHMFQSRFIGSYHIVGRIGMTLVFMSLYFLFKYRQKKYTVCLLLGLLLTFSTLKFQIIISLIIGLAFWFLISFFNRLRGDVVKRGLKICTTGIIVLSIVFFSTYLLKYASILRTKNPPGIDSLKRRSIRVARAADVFVYTFPLGTGLNMSSYLLGTDDVPWKVSRRVGQFIGYDLDYVKYLIVTQQPTFKYSVRRGFSVHNLWVQVIIEFGVLGLLFVAYIWLKGVKMFVHIYQMQKRSPMNMNFASHWAVFMMVFTICLSVLFSCKFNNFWYFGLIFAFLELCIRNRAMENGFTIRLPDIKSA